MPEGIHVSEAPTRLASLRRALSLARWQLFSARKYLPGVWKEQLPPAGEPPVLLCLKILKMATYWCNLKRETRGIILGLKDENQLVDSVHVPHSTMRYYVASSHVSCKCNLNSFKPCDAEFCPWIWGLTGEHVLTDNRCRECSLSPSGSSRMERSRVSRH